MGLPINFFKNNISKIPFFKELLLIDKERNPLQEMKKKCYITSTTSTNSQISLHF